MSDGNDTPLATDPVMYDRPAMHRDALRRVEEGAKANALMTPEAAKQHRDTSVVMTTVKRYDITSDEAGALADLDALAHQKAPDAETRAQWASEAKAALLATYGPDGVGQAIRDANRFVKQDPQLYRFADRGFGDRKELVLMAARLGTAARKAGRLK